MRETTIQLPDVNQTTISQWFIKREKKEQETLKQGITPPHQEATSSQPLPAAVPLPPALPQVSFPFPFTFVLPDNTTGRATLRGPAPRCRPLQPKPVPPRGPVPIQPKQTDRIPVVPPQTVTTVTVAVPPKPTKKQQDESSSQKRHHSLYDRICSLCGKARDPTTHRQYYGNWYCQTMMTEDFEKWKENHQKSKKIKRKKTIKKSI